MGIRLLIVRLPAVKDGATATGILWVLGCVSLSAYSVAEIVRGGVVLGSLGSLAGAASMFVVARRFTRAQFRE
jgi:hypothetical protein